MQSLSGGVLQELQQQGETQSEDVSSEQRTSQGGRGGISPRQKSSTSVLLSRSRSSSSSTSPPLFLQAPAREPSRESPSELLGGRDLSRGELSLSLRTPGERSEPGPGTTATPSWPRTTAEVSSQLLGRRAGTNASLRGMTPESIPESIQQYNLDMRALLAKTPAILSHSLTIPPTPGSRQSSHSISSISSITSEESYASSFAYSLRRTKPDLRLLRKSSKPSQHLKPKPTVPKALVDPSRSPSFYKPRVVEDTRSITSKTKDLTPSPLPSKSVTLTLTELLKSDPAIKSIQRVTTLGSESSQRKQKVTTLKPAISRPALSRSISEQQFINSAASVEAPRRPPAKATRQLRFEDSHASISGRSSPHEFAANSHLKLADPATGFRKNSHLKKHYHDVTPPEDEPGVSTPALFQHDDSYFHTFGADTMYNAEFVPTQTRASDKLRSVVQVIAAATPRKSLLGGGSDPRPAASNSTAQSPRKRASSTLFSLFRKNTIKEEIEGEAIREGKSHKSRPEVRRFGSPEHSARPTPSPRLQTPTITVEASPDHDSTRRRSIVPELHMPSYFARPKTRRFDSEWSSGPSPGHAISPGGSSEAISESGSHSPYPQRSRRHHRSSSEALSPMGRSRNSPSMRSREPHTDSGQANGTEKRLSIGLMPQMPASHEFGFVTPVPGPEDSAKALSATAEMDASDSHVDAELSQPLTRRGTVFKRKSSIWKGVMHGLRKMSSVGFLDQEHGETDDIKPSKRYGLSIMPKLSKMSLPRVKLQASRSSLYVRNGRLVRKASLGSCLQPEQGGGDDESHVDEQTADHHVDIQRTPEVPAPRAIRPEDLIVTEFEQTPFSKRYYDAIRAEQQVIRALMDETIEEDDEADDEIVLGFEQNVPDHLPNSPLCPLSPKHKSGGKAICPLHGKYKRRKSVPSPQHKLEIVFDTREELPKAGPSTLGADGTELFVGRLDVRTFPSTGLERRRMHTSSMGNDGTDSIVVQLDVSEVWSRPGRRRLKQWESEPRGRTLVRGESALDIRRRRRQKSAR